MKIGLNRMIDIALGLTFGSALLLLIVGATRHWAAWLVILGTLGLLTVGLRWVELIIDSALDEAHERLDRTREGLHRLGLDLDEMLEPDDPGQIETERV